MIEYAAGRVDIQIDEAEKVFRGREKKKPPEPEKKKDTLVARENPPRPESGGIIEDDPFYAVIARYPGCAVDYCLVKNDHTASGYNAHRFALLWACRKLFVDEKGEAICHFDVGKADVKPVPAAEQFSLPQEPWTGTRRLSKGEVTWYKQVTDGGPRPYWQAFLMPPTRHAYTAEDFRAVNAALFPNGTEELEVCEWTTDWSEYFDDGREWWGTLCLTVYDKSLDRFAVIMASATD